MFALRATLWLSFAACLALQAGPLRAERTAIIAISPDLGTWDRVVALPRVNYEVDWLRASGYFVRLLPGTRDNIAQALANPQVRAISYFGHAARPSMEHIDATGWKNLMYNHLIATYRQQGVRQNEAMQLANAEVQNFGLELVRNHSCSSLWNDSLARQFVRPGGLYHGSRAGNYVPCPTPFMLLTDVQFFLDEYRVPGNLPAIPYTVTECERGPSANICGTWTWYGSPPSSGYQAQWENGASAMLNIDRFDEAWVILSRHDTTGVSAGLWALYVGRRYGDQVTNGTVTWQWQGKTWSGTWNAKWASPQAPVGGQG